MKSDIADYLSKIGEISILSREDETTFFINLHQRGELLWKYLISLFWENDQLIDELSALLKRKKKFKDYFLLLIKLRSVDLELIKEIINFYKEKELPYEEKKLKKILKSEKNLKLNEIIKYDKKLSKKFLEDFITEGIYALIKNPINFELFVLLKDFLEKEFKKDNLSQEEHNKYREKFIKNLVYIDRSRNKFTTANLKLVVALSKRYMNLSLPWIDIIQEGNLGLFKAIEKFDHKTGNKFSTYAIWWIKQMIIRSIIEKERTIRVPFYMLDQLNKIKKVVLKYLSLENRVPTLDEIEKETNIPHDKIEQIMAYSDINVVSINAPISRNSSNETFFEEIIEDTRNINTVDRLEDEFISDIIKKNMENLTPMQKNVLNLRYGFDGSFATTLDEIGKKYNLSRERIRQIELKALFKLKKFIKNKNIIKKILDNKE